MKNAIWNKGLYIEGLRRTRTMTITFAAVISVIAVLLVLASFGSVGGTMIVVSTELKILLIAVFGAAPALTGRLFSFLNKREASDFYHSIPHKRTSLFLSYVTALVTQFAVIIVSVGAAFTAIFNVIYLIDHDRFTFRPLESSAEYSIAAYGGNYKEIYYSFFECYGYFLKALLVYFTAMLLVAAIILFARSMSGTGFNAAVMSCIIIAFPRLMLFVIKEALCTALPMVPYDSPGILNAALNAPIGLTLGFVGLTSDPTFSMQSALYTFIAALIYTVAALFIFKFRRSEAAGSAAPSETMRAFYRIAVFCSVSFITTVLFAGGLVTYLNDDQHSWLLMKNGGIWFIIMYTVALIMFFLYELIASRRWKNLIRALPSLAIAIGVNVLLGLSVFGVFSAEMNFKPSPEEVSYITSTADLGLTYTYDSGYSVADDYAIGVYGPLNYAINKCGGVKITDKNAIAVVCEALSDKRIYFSSTRHSGTFKALRIGIKTNRGLSVKYRIVYLNDREADILVSKYKYDENFAEATKTLPPMVKSSGNIAVSLFGNVTQYKTSTSNADDIIDALTADFKELDAGKYLELLQSGKNDGWVKYVAEVNGTVTQMNVPLSYVLTPRTCETVIRLTAKSIAGEEAAMDTLNCASEYEWYSSYMTVTMSDGENEWSAAYKDGKDVSKYSKAIYGALEKQDRNAAETGYLSIYLIHKKGASYLSRYNDYYMCEKYTFKLKSGTDTESLAERIALRKQ